MELSSYLLEIPNDGYTTHSQLRLAVQHSKVLQDDWFILEPNSEAALNINMPYSHFIFFRRSRTNTAFHPKDTYLYDEGIVCILRCPGSAVIQCTVREFGSVIPTNNLYDHQRVARVPYTIVYE